MKSDLKTYRSKVLFECKDGASLYSIPCTDNLLSSLQNETRYGKDHYYSSRKNNYPTHIWKDLNKRKTISS